MKMLGSKIDTTYKENIANGPQLEQTVATLVNQGYKMIFGTSFGYLDTKLAAKYPGVLFEQATMTDTAKNLSEYFGAGEDTIFLSGMAAGAATKNGKLGYVVPFATPEVIRHANAFALGAQLMHPGATVRSCGRTRGSPRRRRRRRLRACSRQALTCSARTSTPRRPGSSPRQGHPLGGL